MSKEDEIALRLFEECYQRETEQTPEAQRNMASGHNDRLIFEMLRLGIPGANTEQGAKGIYLGELTAQIWDKVVRKPNQEKYVPPEVKQYLADMEEVKRRLVTNCALVAYTCGAYHDSQGIIIFNLKDGKSYDLGTKIRSHQSPAEGYVSDIIDKLTDGHLSFRETENLDKGTRSVIDGLYEAGDENTFVKGRYFTFGYRDGEKITEEIETRVIYLGDISTIEESQKIITDLEQDPLNSDEINLPSEIIKAKKDPFSWEDLDSNEEKYFRKIIEGIISTSTEDIERTKKFQELFLQNPGYIFITNDNSILKPEFTR